MPMSQHTPSAWRRSAGAAGALLLVLLVAIAAAACSSAATLAPAPGGPSATPSVAASSQASRDAATPNPTAEATAAATAASASTPGPPATAAPPASVGPTATPRPTPRPTITPTGFCSAANLAARITMWEGAMGHRIATVEMTNTGPAACLLHTTGRPQLVDKAGAVLIDGAPATAGGTLKLGPGDVATTLVQDSNYCGPVPAQPVSVAFVLPAGAGRVVAAPLAAGDGVPPCLGDPGSAGSIEMHPWARK
jgi:hypothetical protein